MNKGKVDHKVEFTVPASLVAQGDVWLAKQSTAGLDRMVETRRAELVHYLETGEMLKPQASRQSRVGVL